MGGARVGTWGGGLPGGGLGLDTSSAVGGAGRLRWGVSRVGIIGLVGFMPNSEELGLDGGSGDEVSAAAIERRPM